MIFADLVPGDAVFVDANIMTYAAQPHPRWGASCLDLLQRIENQEISGYTSTIVLAEVSHLQMIKLNKSPFRNQGDVGLDDANARVSGLIKGEKFRLPDHYVYPDKL